MIFNPIRILSRLISLRFLMKKVERRFYAVQNSLELTCNDSCDECASQNFHFIENILNSIEIIFFAFFLFYWLFSAASIGSCVAKNHARHDFVSNDILSNNNLLACLSLGQRCFNNYLDKQQILPLLMKSTSLQDIKNSVSVG